MDWQMIAGAAASVGVLLYAFRDKIAALWANAAGGAAQTGAASAVALLYQSAVKLPAAKRDAILPHLDALAEVFVEAE